MLGAHTHRVRKYEPALERTTGAAGASNSSTSERSRKGTCAHDGENSQVPSLEKNYPLSVCQRVSGSTHHGFDRAPSRSVEAANARGRLCSEARTPRWPVSRMAAARHGVRETSLRAATALWPTPAVNPHSNGLCRGREPRATPDPAIKRQWHRGRYSRKGRVRCRHGAGSVTLRGCSQVGTPPTELRADPAWHMPGANAGSRAASTGATPVRRTRAGCSECCPASPSTRVARRPSR